jgi:hypothetical protein
MVNRAWSLFLYFLNRRFSDNSTLLSGRSCYICYVSVIPTRRYVIARSILL